MSDRETLERFFMDWWKDNFNTLDDEEVEYIIRNGFKGMNEYTDEELYAEFKLFHEDNEEWCAWSRQIKTQGNK